MNYNPSSTKFSWVFASLLGAEVNSVRMFPKPLILIEAQKTIMIRDNKFLVLSLELVMNFSMIDVSE